MLSQEIFEKLKRYDDTNSSEMSVFFYEIVGNLKKFLNMDAVYTKTSFKAKNPNDSENFMRNSILDLGVERIEVDNSLIIQVEEERSNPLPLILLREALYSFVPQEIASNQIIKITINLIVRFYLESSINIDEWKDAFQEEYVEFSSTENYSKNISFNTIEKLLRPDGLNISEIFVKFWFNYVRTNVPSIAESKEEFYYELEKQYIMKSSKPIFHDDMVEAFRILIKIFYDIGKYTSLLDYQTYFKDFQRNKIIETDLSLRRFTECLKWIGRVSQIAPTYEINWHLIDIGWMYCSLAFHPALRKKEIDRIVHKFPFIMSPSSSPGQFAYEISFWIIYPRPYKQNIIRLIEKLEDYGYITSKSLIILREYRNNSVNLNYFKDYYKKGRIINPRHPSYDKKYEISFENVYEFMPKENPRKLSRLDTIILENQYMWGITGIGFERRSEVSRTIKSRILFEIAIQKKLIKNFKKKIDLIQGNNEIKQFFIVVYEKYARFGIFYIKEYLEGIIKYLKIVDKILIDQPNIKNIYQFQEYIKSHSSFSRLDNALLFDRIDLKKEVFRKYLPLYFNNKQTCESKLGYIKRIIDFLNYCFRLRIYNLKDIMRIIEDKSVSTGIYIKKQKKLDNIRKNFKEKKITGRIIDNIIEEFSNTDPPILIPYVLNTLLVGLFAKYYINIILKYTPETIELLNKIKLYFPRIIIDVGIDAFIKKKVVVVLVYFVNLEGIEKEMLFSVFFNLFGDAIISIQRYYFDGFLAPPNIRAYYDLENQSFFYTKDLFDQYFLYVRKIFGDNLKISKETPFKRINLHLNAITESSFDNLVSHVEKRLSRQQNDFSITKLKELVDFHSNLGKVIPHILQFKQIKKLDFFKRYVKSINFLPDFHKFGISQYFLYVRPLDLNQVDLRLLFNNTFQNVSYQASFGRSRSLFISYLFPFRTPNMAYLNWLTKSKRNISEYCMFHIKSMHLIFNFHQNLDSSGWNLDYKDFETYIHHILFNSVFREESLEMKSFPLSKISSSHYLGPNTQDFAKLNNIYDSKSVDIKSVIGTTWHSKENDITDLMKEKHIFPYVKLKNLDFQDKVTIVLVDLDEKMIEKLLRIFNFFNYGFIYEIEGEYFKQGFPNETPFEKGLMIELYLPLCGVSDFLKLFRKTFHVLKIKDYLILNDLVKGNTLIESVYGSLDFLKDYNPLKNLLWSKKDNIWINHKLFNENFEPQYPELNR